MAMMTKRPGNAAKSNPTGAKRMASGKADATNVRSAQVGPAKMPSAKAAAHILEAAKGPRIVSHRKIEEAVEKVFRERSRARA